MIFSAKHADDKIGVVRIVDVNRVQVTGGNVIVTHQVDGGLDVTVHPLGALRYWEVNN